MARPQGWGQKRIIPAVSPSFRACIGSPHSPHRTATSSPTPIPSYSLISHMPADLPRTYISTFSCSIALNESIFKGVLNSKARIGISSSRSSIRMWVWVFLLIFFPSIQASPSQWLPCPPVWCGVSSTHQDTHVCGARNPYSREGMSGPFPVSRHEVDQRSPFLNRIAVVAFV